MYDIRRLAVLAVFLWASAALPNLSQAASPSGPDVAAHRSPANPTSADRLPRRPGRARPRSAARFPEVRSIEGVENNGAHPSWGAAQIELLRLTTVDYADGANSPAGEDQISAREISNLCSAQAHSILNASLASDFVWQWGQFLDHDIDLTAIADPRQPFNIPVPKGDAWFDPLGSGTEVIPLDRSHYNVVAGVRQQTNEVTAYIDASNVYGSDQARADELRTLDGTGRLKTSSGGLLPFNENGFPNAPDSSPSFFLAGDFRANEQVALTAMHTLFVREHNFWADTIRAQNPARSGDAVYQTARAIVGAEMQAITYRHFLPILLGRRTLSRYRGYDPEVNAGIANVFSTVAYRFGHSMLSPKLLRLDAKGAEIAAGNLSLADAFFSPQQIVDYGIEPLLRGLASQRAQEVDVYVVDEVRNFLFAGQGPNGFDLASLNIQRARDHGMPRYNQVRKDYGLEPVTDWSDITENLEIQANLATAYSSVDDIDIWVGGLAEAHVRGALVGETFLVVLKDQFERLRDGDRFWYRSYLPRTLVRLVERQDLGQIIRRNTGVGRELRGNLFRTRGK